MWGSLKITAAREPKVTASEVRAGRWLRLRCGYLWEAHQCFIAQVPGQRTSRSGSRVKTFPLEQIWFLLCFCGFLQEGGEGKAVLRRTVRCHVHGQGRFSVARCECSRWQENRMSKGAWVLGPSFRSKRCIFGPLVEGCIWVSKVQFLAPATVP